MAWKTEDDKKLATDLLKKNRKYKEILDALDKRCDINDLYALKNDLRSKGEILPAGSKKKKTAGKTSRHKNGRSNGLEKEIGAEQQRLQAELERYNQLMEEYKDTKVDFVDFIEAKAAKTKRKLDLVNELIELS